MLRNAVKVLLISLRPYYVNHLVKICFSCLFLVSCAFLTEYAVVTNLFILNARKLTSNLLTREVALLPLEMSIRSAFEVF